ncbi:MAG: WhiB family transcriptional regulator [Actinobacteria bacterium]|nr:WhiB family transcriptional regulator [Actinomycetota bacterium]
MSFISQPVDLEGLRHALAFDDLAWHDRANCQGANADLFFPERGASTRAAKAICRECQVRGECLDFALRSGEKFGIWGGLSERERRRVRRERQVAAARRAS